MQGIEAHSKHPGLLTPSTARLRPALVVTSSFNEHRKTEHPSFTYLWSPIFEVSEVQNSTICLVISFLVFASAEYSAAGAPGQAPSPVLLSVGRAPSSGASVSILLLYCSRNLFASFINLFLSLCDVFCHTSGHTPSGLFVPLYLLITRSPIRSHLGLPGSTSSGLGLCVGVYFLPVSYTHLTLPTN